jgi:hypothetical protein
MRANLPESKVILRWMLRWSFWLYVLIAASIGTFYILYTASVVYTNATLPGPMPVRLPNGFQFDPDWETKTSNQHITDAAGREIVAPDVKSIMWHENTVYGYRRGPSGEVYYFICVYGEDCSGRQHLNDIEFNRALKEGGLPEFVRWKRKGYWELLVEQDKRERENEKTFLNRKSG